MTSPSISAITMPKFGLSATEGKVVSWLVAEGEPVAVGDEIVEIETSKTVTAYESPVAGILRRQVANSDDENMPIGALIAVVANEGVSDADIDAYIKNFTPSELAEVEDATDDDDAGDEHRQQSKQVGSAYSETPLSSQRRITAQRLAEAKQTIPHFYLTVDCQVDEIMAIRSEMGQRADAVKPSVNDFVIKAVAQALKSVPEAGGVFAGTAIRTYEDIDISVAVDSPTGLITPIIKCADRKDLPTISKEMKSLAAKASDGRLQPEEYEGGVFTISNLGMFGIKSFSAIINPPQSCILAVGTAEQRAVVKAGKLAAATIMTCTLSVDHRVIDGVVGARFLGAFKDLIEEPRTLLN